MQQRREQRVSVRSEHSMRQRLMLALREVGRLEAEKEELEEALEANRHRDFSGQQHGIPPSPESKKDTRSDTKQMLRFRCQRLQRRVAELEAQQGLWEERAADGARATTVSAQEWHRLSSATHRLTKEANETFDALMRAEDHSGRVASTGEAHLRKKLASQLCELENISSSSPILPRGFQQAGPRPTADAESTPPSLPRNDAAPQQELVDTLLQALGEADREISFLRDRVQASESRACSASESAAEAHRSEALLPHYRAAVHRYRRLSQELAARLEQEESRRSAAEDQAAHWSRAWVQLDAWVRGHPAFHVEEFSGSMPPARHEPPGRASMDVHAEPAVVATPARTASIASVVAPTPVLSTRPPAPAAEPFSPQQAARPQRKGVGNAEGVSLSAPGRERDEEEEEEVMQASLPRSGNDATPAGVSSEGSSPWDELLSFGDALLAEADDVLEGDGE